MIAAAEPSREVAAVRWRVDATRGAASGAATGGATGAAADAAAEVQIGPIPRAWRERLARLWKVGRFVVGILLGAVALWAVDGQRGEISGATAALSHLHMQWLAIGIVAELLSFAAFAGLQVWLLRVGRVAMPMPRMFGITLGAGAIASSIPGGPVVSSMFAYRQYRRAGADEALSAWTLVATLTCTALSLTALATAGVLLAERQGAAFDIIGVTLGVLIVAVLASAIVWQRRLVVSLVAGVLRLSQRYLHYPRADGGDVVAGLLRRLKTVHMNLADLAGAIAWSICNWILDCGCLVCCFLCVGAQVPWHGLLLAYGAAQLATNLPITPGGLGVAEGSLTIGLVEFGGVQSSTVAAVLLYRIISFWGFLPVGWLSWAGVTLRNKRADRHADMIGDEREVHLHHREEFLPEQPHESAAEPVPVSGEGIDNTAGSSVNNGARSGLTEGVGTNAGTARGPAGGGGG